jgi:hypothetical protein
MVLLDAAETTASIPNSRDLTSIERFDGHERDGLDGYWPGPWEHCPGEHNWA